MYLAFLSVLCEQLIRLVNNDIFHAHLNGNRKDGFCVTLGKEENSYNCLEEDLRDSGDPFRLHMIIWL